MNNSRLLTPSLTVSLVGLPVPTFHFVAGHGNLAPGALRSQGCHAIAGRGVQGPSVSHGPAPVGHGRGFVDALAIRGPPGREIVLGVPAVGRARDGLGVVGVYYTRSTPTTPRPAR
ncbi:hypothetical protein Tco_1497656, partial [Tanacetum coccineum]